MTPERKIEILVKSQNKLIGRVGELEQQIIELNGRISVILEVVGQHSGQLRSLDEKTPEERRQAAGLVISGTCLDCGLRNSVYEMHQVGGDDAGPLYCCRHCFLVRLIRGVNK